MSIKVGSFIKSLRVRDFIKTKIVCTIGPASNSREILRKMALAGMNAVRLNFSHGTHQEHAQVIRRIRKVSNELGKPIAVIQDLPGPKIRIGKISSGSVRLKEGTPFTLTTREVDGNSKEVSINLGRVPRRIGRGYAIFLADGFVKLAVMSIDKTDINCKVLMGGEITSGKGVNLPGMTLDIPPITDVDRKHLSFGLRNHVDYIAFSFLKSGKDISDAKKLVQSYGLKTPIIAKIEKREALGNIDEMINLADGIMIARGDLGVEIPIEEVANVQKHIMYKCNLNGKFAITATQMLVSMVNHSRPTRPEVTDVANAIIDGTDAVMLSEETAIGKYPIESVKMLTKIASVTETNLPYEQILKTKSDALRLTLEDALSFAAARIAIDMKSAVIATPTRSGLTARRISRYRPPLPIIALTPNVETAMELTLAWGIFPIVIKTLNNIDLIFKETEKTIINLGLARRGENLVIIAGDPEEAPGTTKLLKVQKLR